MRPGLTEILIIVGIVLLLFGAGKLADIGKGLGEGIRNFKKGLGGDDDEGKKELPEADKTEAVKAEAVKEEAVKAEADKAEADKA